MSQAEQPANQSAIAADWLAEQVAQQRELLLVIDRLAEPDPIKTLFNADLIQDYVNIYQGTEFAEMADAGPWLVRFDTPDAELIQALFDPESHWGWLASAAHVDLAALTHHWHDRMLIDEQGQRSLYRFQDNRIVARHLGEMEASQRPLLLGPLTSALCWDGHDWQWFDNGQPGEYPEPFEKPWLSIPEPEHVRRAVTHHNLELWLWENHTHATTKLAETRVLSEWLDRQLDKAKEWHWHSEPQLHLLLRYQLDPAVADHPAWLPADQETPDAHHSRVSAVLTSSYSAQG